MLRMSHSITLNRQIVECERCPRLIGHCREVAVTKRRAFLDWDYWGKPVPSFGDTSARLLILGLAPGAHGANRTGRMFTGDRSGDFLYRSLYAAGFASQPESHRTDDGLQLSDAWITAAAHCAPPGNRPAPQELRNCRPFLERELEMLANIQVVVALGKIAFDTYLGILKSRGEIERLADFKFGHGVLYDTLAPRAPGLLSPEPAEHFHRQVNPVDAGRSVRARCSTYPIRTSSRCTAPVVEADVAVTNTLTSERTPKSSR